MRPSHHCLSGQLVSLGRERSPFIHIGQKAHFISQLEVVTVAWPQLWAWPFPQPEPEGCEMSTTTQQKLWLGGVGSPEKELKMKVKAEKSFLSVHSRFFHVLCLCKNTQMPPFCPVVFPMNSALLVSTQNTQKVTSPLWGVTDGHSPT